MNSERMCKLKKMSELLAQRNALKYCEYDEPTGDVYCNACLHLRRDEDGGTPFCADCALVFGYEIVFADEYCSMDYHHPRGDQNTADCSEPEAEAESEDPVDVLTPVSAPTPTPKTVKDLRKIAKERGIKYCTTMTKKDLCMVLGIEIVRPIKYLFKNEDTGEEHGFHSIYRASKEMGINPGLVHYYVGREVTIDGFVYTVSEV